MSSPPSPLVWFLLLDSATGEPYKKTTASKVSVSSSADVDDFRDAVKAKHSNKLSTFDAADLLVYKNKAVFVDGKEGPLNPTESLGLLGSKEDMLVVVVPYALLDKEKSAPAPHLQVVSDNNFLFLGKLLQAKKTKGVRATLYTLASSCLGYHDGENDAFWYEGNYLMLRVLFESKQNADSFHRRLNDESLYHRTAISQLAITDVSLARTANAAGKQIFATDYNPDDYDSSQDTASCLEATTILDSSTPLFQFQRIESDSVFGRHYKADSCHLIDTDYYACNPQEEDDVENNRLALSSDVHSWLIGRNVDVPLFKLTISTDLISSELIENRYQVPLLVTAFDSDSARLLFPRLREGSLFNQDRKLEAIVSVYVLNPTVFTTCIEWRASRTQKIWDDYNNMEPAVV